MRVLVLSKRQYLGKDLLDDRFFRNFEIPEELAKKGHEVFGVALSYRPRSQGHMQPGHVSWTSVNAIPGFPVYFWELAKIIKKLQPDVIWASSDIYHAILAWRLHIRFGVPFIIDLYDNYESFGASRLPGAIALFRSACRAASGLTLVSHSLYKFVTENYRVHCPRHVIGNAIRKDIFRPKSKVAARKALGLPEQARLIGAAGAISASRGIQVMFEAFLKLSAHDPDLWLVYAGPRDATPRRYRHARIIDLGELPHEQVPDVFNALDVTLICNLDSAFGRYCFPQKLYEIVACGTPLVAAAVGDTAELLAPWPSVLFEPGSVEGMVDCLTKQLEHPIRVELEPPGWSDAADHLEILLTQVIARG